MWHDLRPLARQVPGLRCLRQPGRGAARLADRERRGSRPEARPHRVGARRGCGSHLDRSRGARPCPGRWARSGIARARRRGARRRKVDPPAHRARGDRACRPSRTPRHGRGVRIAGLAPRSAARRRRVGRHPRRDRARLGLRDARSGASRRVRHRFGADAPRLRAQLGSGIRRAGSRGRREAPPRREGGGRGDGSWSVT